MKPHCVSVTLAVAALAVTSFGGTLVAPASASAAAPGCEYGSNDFNQDGRTDVAIGATSPDVEDDERPPGVVEVRVSDGAGTTVHRLTAPDPQVGDQFGAAVAEVAASAGAADRCSMVAVGAPGYDVDGLQDVGAVFLYRWDQADGFVLARTLVPGSDGVPGPRDEYAGFGHALAAPYRAGGVDGAVTPLYVGAPWHNNSGAVYRLTFTTEGEPTVDESTLVVRGSPGIPDVAFVGLGKSLAAVDGGFLAGAPITGRFTGGFLSWRDDGTPAQFITQDTAGVPGTGEEYDDFGAVIYAAHEVPAAGGGHYVMVGAPGEAIGTALGAGSAIRFVYDGGVDLDHAQGFNQDTAGVAGRAETGDNFGSSFGSYGPTRILVGTPHEDIGDVGNAGMVQGLSGDRSWQQDTAGVPGTSESGDGFGDVIGNALYGMPGGPGTSNWLGKVLVAVPGEDVNGAVVAGLPGSTGKPARWTPESDDSVSYGISIGRTN